jgi:hypothetical protein
MTPASWIRARLVELGAALFTASLLIGGLAIGVPFLRARIPETFFYSFCCVAAVLLRAALDLVARSVVLAVRRIRPGTIVIPALSRYPAGVIR